MNERDHFRNVSVDGIMLLKPTLKKYGVMLWAQSMGPAVCSFKYDAKPSGFIKNVNNFWPAVRLLTSQEYLHSMKSAFKLFENILSPSSG
jgi:hypothetical protein